MKKIETRKIEAKKFDAKKLDKKSSNPLFVGISNPENVKTSLLESSKDILIILKQLEEIKSLREQKRAKIDEMNTKLRNISTLLSKLKRTVPSLVTLDRTILTKEPVRSSIAKQSPAQKKNDDSPSVPAKPKTELDKLEEEIAFIESKLGKL